MTDEDKDKDILRRDQLADSRFVETNKRISALETAVGVHVEWTKKEYICVMSRTRDLEVVLDENTKLTKEIRDVIVTAKTGLRVLGSVGVAVKWVASVASAIIVIWGLIWLILHPGTMPPR